MAWPASRGHEHVERGRNSPDNGNIIRNKRPECDADITFNSLVVLVVVVVVDVVVGLLSLSFSCLLTGLKLN